jgi:hypothetical protein
MTRTDEELHIDTMQRFLDLANSIKDEGIEPRLVSAGLMTASAMYATYALADNDGRLTPKGSAKLAKAYKQQVDRVQEIKRRKTGA